MVVKQAIIQEKGIVAKWEKSKIKSVISTVKVGETKDKQKRIKNKDNVRIIWDNLEGNSILIIGTPEQGKGEISFFFSFCKKV